MYDEPDGNVIFEKSDRKFFPHNGTLMIMLQKSKKGGGREFNFAGVENAEGWVIWKNDKVIIVEIVEYTVE